ncbi:MAG: ATP phosphoribosyltransferase regulatory subunit [Candidatus Pacearchaeota archaeon]
MVEGLIKGFQDFIGDDAIRRCKIKKIIEETFQLYGFEPAETPIIESEEFVKSGNENDEAVSDIFKLKDKGKRNLALRYEFTFQLKRISKNKKLPYKRYQIGEVFRDEPVSSNRFRQFTQCDCDVVGSDLKNEAETLVLVKEVFYKLGIKGDIYFNNRKLMNEILDEFKINNKEKAIREIDKLDKLPESEIKNNLKKYDAEKILSIFKKPESYFKKYKNYDDILNLKNICKNYRINLKFLPSLARGLSYYNGTVVEVKSIGKESICAGGAYLVNGIQSFGVSFGLERICAFAKIKSNENKILIISLNRDKESIEFVEKLRKNRIPCSLFYGKPSKALDYANAYKFNFAIFIGDNEIKRKKATIKDLKSGKINNIPMNAILNKFMKD